MDRYGPLIYGYCRRRGLQQADAADLGQEVLTQVAQSIRSLDYRPEKGRFRNWLGTIVRSKIARFLQRAARNSLAGKLGTSTLEQIEGAIEAEWTAEFYRHVVRTAMEQIRSDFEPHNWRAFELSWLEDRPAAEVALELNMTKAAVFMAKSRILKRLREEVLLLAEDAPHLVPLD